MSASMELWEDEDRKRMVAAAKRAVGVDKQFIGYHYPFFGHILQRFRLVIDEVSTPIAAVNVVKGVTFLYINPVQYLRYGEESRRAILYHEVLHIVGRHIVRRKDRDMSLWNRATDYAVNCMVPDEEGISLLREDTGALFPEREDLPPGHSAEWYYQELLKKSKEGTLSNKDEDKNRHIKWEESENTALDEMAMDAAVKEAKEQVPSNDHPQEIIREWTKTVKPSADWNRIFVKTYGKVLSNRTWPSNSRINRRLPGVKPGKRRLKEVKVYVVLDTSASVINKEECLETFFYALKKMKVQTKASITVLECDTEVRRSYSFEKGMEDIEVRGGGATSLQAPFRYLEEKRLRADLIVYFTDGEGEASYAGPSNTIWLLPPNGKPPVTKDGRRVEWGEVIEMSEGKG